MAVVESQLLRIDEDWVGPASGANDYAAYINTSSKHPKAAVATTSSWAVPFYQMVVHGYVDYAGLPLNHSRALECRC